MRILRFLPALVFASFLNAQPAQVQVNADCVVAFTITAQSGTGPSSGSFDNRQVGCNSWQLQYGSTGFTGVSLTLQSSTDNATWGTMGGTLTFGTNPLTSTTGASMLLNSYGTSFAPYVRVILTTGTGSGTVQGILLGFRAAGAAGTSGGGVTSSVNVSQYGGTNVVSAGLAGLFATGGAAADGTSSTGNPVLIGGEDAGSPKLAHTIQTDTFGGILPSGVTAPTADGLSNTITVPAMAQAGASVASTNRVFQYLYNGATWDRNFVCTNQALFNLSSSGNTQIIAAGTGVLRICSISFSTTAAEDVKVTQGTGTNCATGTADVTGLYKSVQSMALDFGSTSALRSAANQAICLNQSAAQALGGIVIYATAY